jgi:hypothetical protein
MKLAPLSRNDMFLPIILLPSSRDQGEGKKMTGKKEDWLSESPWLRRTVLLGCDLPVFARALAIQGG